MKPETLILFTCESCGYRARVPRAFDGAAILCPSCTSSQVVTAKPETGPRSGDTQVIKSPEPAPAPASGPGPAGSAAATPAPAAPSPFAPSAPSPLAPSTPPPTAPPAIAPPAIAPPTPAAIAPTEKLQLGKISFECTKCHARARIPSEYAGKVVRCPSCDAVQIALGGASPATGRVVKGQATVFAAAKLDQNGKIIFTCTACAYSARLAQGYAGKAIQCPGCKSAQMVGILPLGATHEVSKTGTSTIVSTVTQAVRRGDLQAPVPPAEKAGTSPLGNPVIGSGPRPVVAATQPAKVPTPPTTPPPSPQAMVASASADRPSAGESTDLFMTANPNPESKTSGRVVRRGKTERITTPEPAVPKPAPIGPATQRTPIPTAPSQSTSAVKPGPQVKPPSGVKPASELVKAPVAAVPTAATKVDAAPVPARSGSANWVFLVVVVLAVVALAAAAVFVLNGMTKADADARVQEHNRLRLAAEKKTQDADEARKKNENLLEEQQKKADEAVTAKARVEKDLEQERKKAEEANAAKVQAETAKAQAEAKAAEVQKMLTDLNQQIDELRKRLDAQLKPDAKAIDAGKPKDAKPVESKPAP